MKILQPYHTGFVVSDIERSIDFYTSVLGMKIERQPSTVSTHWLAGVVGYDQVSITIAMVGVGRGSSIELLQYNEPHGRAKTGLDDRNNVGSAHCGMLVDDVRSWYTHLESKGVRTTGPPVFRDADFPWARYAFYFQDPDGNWLEFAERAPRPEGSMEN